MFCIFAFVIVFLTDGGLTNPLPKDDFVEETIITNEHTLTDLSDVPLPPSNILLDQTNFSFILSPKNVCNVESLYFLVLVHSSPQNIELRNVIRDNWGSIKEVGGTSIRVVFLLGQPSIDNSVHLVKRKSSSPSTPSSTGHLDNDLHGRQQQISGSSRDRKTFRPRQENTSAKIPASEMQTSIEKEAETYGDIIQGNFIDTFHNLTYKHLMGFKWIVEDEHCSQKPSFVVKSDDTVFIETFHLYNFVSAIYGDNPKRSLVCDVIPTGTTPRRRDKLTPHLKEYMGENYPEYCSGMAYLVTPDLASDFIKASTKVPKFWLDDIYVTGYLRELLNLRPFYLNLRYTYDEKSYLKWLHGKPPLPLPYLFASVEMTNPEWKSIMKQLWLKTVSIHLGKTISSTSQKSQIHIASSDESITSEKNSTLIEVLTLTAPEINLE